VSRIDEYLWFRRKKVGVRIKQGAPHEFLFYLESTDYTSMLTGLTLRRLRYEIAKAIYCRKAAPYVNKVIANIHIS